MLISCEVCGSTDIIKDESGYFVCQGCGSRYTAEAMRNMLSQQSNMVDSHTQENASDTHGVSDTRMNAKKPNNDANRLMEQFNAGNYEIAAAIWERIERDKDSLEPLTVFYGTMAKGLVPLSNGKCQYTLEYTLKPYNALKNYLLKEGYPIQLIGSLLIKASFTCAEKARIKSKEYGETSRRCAAAQTIASLKRAQDEYRFAIDAAETLSEIARLSFFDAGINVGKGYRPNAEDANTLDSFWSHCITPVYKTPFMKKLKQRIVTAAADATYSGLDLGIIEGLLPHAQIAVARKYLNDGLYDYANAIYSSVGSDATVEALLECETVGRVLTTMLNQENGFLGGRWAMSYDKTIKACLEGFRNQVNDGHLSGSTVILETYDILISLFSNIRKHFLTVYPSLEERDAELAGSISVRHMEYAAICFSDKTDLFLSTLAEPPEELDGDTIASLEAQAHRLKSTLRIPEKTCKLYLNVGERASSIRCQAYVTHFKPLVAECERNVRLGKDIHEELLSLRREMLKADSCMEKTSDEWQLLNDRLNTAFKMSLVRDREFAQAVAKEKHALESQIQAIKSDINQKRNELSALGLFARRRKKELEGEIERAQSQTVVLSGKIGTIESDIKERWMVGFREGEDLTY